jgi:hypothetical protein
MGHKKVKIYFAEHPISNSFLEEKLTDKQLDRSNYELVINDIGAYGEFYPIDNQNASKRILNNFELHCNALSVSRNFIKGNRIILLKPGKIYVEGEKFKIIKPCSIEVKSEVEPELEGLVSQGVELSNKVGNIMEKIGIVEEGFRKVLDTQKYIMESMVRNQEEEKKDIFPKPSDGSCNEGNSKTSTSNEKSSDQTVSSTKPKNNLKGLFEVFKIKV